MSGRQLQQICVFSGSNPGIRPAYTGEARRLGQLLARRGIGLVYGGASVGLMGAAADAALQLGGTVIGIIPEPLAASEIAHPGLTELRVVGSMHERKAQMAELADGFIAMPGGYGTLEELFEIITWAQLGMHQKPVGLLNIEGYYDPLLTLIEHSISEGFVQPAHARLVVSSPDAASLIELMVNYQPPVLARKWITAQQT